MIASKHSVAICLVAANIAFAGTTKIASLDPVRVFSGVPASVEVRFQNSGETTFESEVFMRVFQLSSATAMPVTARARWNTLKVLSHQTIVHEVILHLPSVRAETRFEVQWIDANGGALGVTSVKAFPTNLLAQLMELCGERPLGIYDPESRLKPLLATANVEFTDVEQAGVETFRGNLMILFVNEPAQLTRLTKMVRRGINVVLISPKTGDRNAEDFVIVNKHREGHWALVHPKAVAQLNTDVTAQLRLLSIARLVTNTNQYDLFTQP